MEEKIYFKDSKGNKLCGILSNPTENKDKPMIILCHGFSSSKNSSTYVALEDSLNKKEISTFRFDFYGHGESEGEFADITISLAVDAVLSAIKFLKEKDYTKIGLVGSSFGGMASLVAASKTEDLFVLALKCPVSDYLGKLIAQKSKAEINSWKENGFINYLSGSRGKLKLNYSFFEDAETYNGNYENYRKIKVPTLIVHGDKDITVPIEQSKKTASLIPDCKLEIIENADHFFKGLGEFEKVTNFITNFILENL
jgi:uncharacterized protein